MVQIQSQKFTLLDLVSATATSGGVPVDSATGRLSLMVFANTLSAGSATMYVDVTNDNTLGWVPYQRLTSNATNTNAQMDTRTAQVTFTAAGTSMVFFPPGDTFNFIRVRAHLFGTGTLGAVLYVN